MIIKRSGQIDFEDSKMNLEDVYALEDAEYYIDEETTLVSSDNAVLQMKGGQEESQGVGQDHDGLQEEAFRFKAFVDTADNEPPLFTQTDEPEEVQVEKKAVVSVDDLRELVQHRRKPRKCKNTDKAVSSQAKSGLFGRIFGGKPA